MFELHDPDANLDRRWDWSEWLPDGDAIQSAQVIGDGVDVADVSHDDDSVTAWISGGTAGQLAKVTCRVTTVQGRQDDRTIHLWVTER